LYADGCKELAELHCDDTKKGYATPEVTIFSPLTAETVVQSHVTLSDIGVDEVVLEQDFSQNFLVFAANYIPPFHPFIIAL
jgi:hypothetical protein